MGVVIAGFDLVEVAGVDILALSSFEWFWATDRPAEWRHDKEISESRDF